MSTAPRFSRHARELISEIEKLALEPLVFRITGSDHVGIYKERAGKLYPVRDYMQMPVVFSSSPSSVRSSRIKTLSTLRRLDLIRNWQTSRTGRVAAPRPMAERPHSEVLQFVRRRLDALPHNKLAEIAETIRRAA